MSLVQEMQIPELPTYHYCLAKIICNPSHPRCYLGECDARSEIETLKEELLTHFDEIDVEQIVYKQLVSTNRSTLETFCSPVEEFADTFCKKIRRTLVSPFIHCNRAGIILCYFEDRRVPGHCRFFGKLLFRFVRCWPRVPLE